MKTELFLPQWLVGLDQNGVVWIQLLANTRRVNVACPSVILEPPVTGVGKGPCSWIPLLGLKLSAACVLSRFSHAWLCSPVDCSPLGSSDWEFSRQEYWSGLPFPSLGGHPKAGIEPVTVASPALAEGFFLYHCLHLGSPEGCLPVV